MPRPEITIHKKTSLWKKPQIIATIGCRQLGLGNCCREVVLFFLLFCLIAQIYTTIAQNYICTIVVLIKIECGDFQNILRVLFATHSQFLKVSIGNGEVQFFNLVGFL